MGVRDMQMRFNACFRAMINIARVASAQREPLMLCISRFSAWDPGTLHGNTNPVCVLVGEEYLQRGRIPKGGPTFRRLELKLTSFSGSQASCMNVVALQRLLWGPSVVTRHLVHGVAQAPHS